MSYSLILLAHGSSDATWCAVFERLHQALAARLQTPLRLAYMELSEPSLESTVAELAAQGTSRAEILPLFFAAGRSEEHTSELQSRPHLVCRLLLEKKNQ